MRIQVLGRIALSEKNAVQSGAEGQKFFHALRTMRAVRSSNEACVLLPTAQRIRSSSLEFSSRGAFQMYQLAQRVVVASLLLGAMLAPTKAAEREDVRRAINLVTSVKM